MIFILKARTLQCDTTESATIQYNTILTYKATIRYLTIPLLLLRYDTIQFNILRSIWWKKILWFLCLESLLRIWWWTITMMMMMTILSIRVTNHLASLFTHQFKILIIIYTQVVYIYIHVIHVEWTLGHTKPHLYISVSISYTKALLSLSRRINLVQSNITYNS